MKPIATALLLCVPIFWPGMLHGAESPRTALLTNGGFEAVDQPMIGHSIPGWNTYGASSSMIAVVPGAAPAKTAALRITRGKAFCYGLAIDPEVDYLFSIRIKAEGAKARIEIHPPPNESPPWSADDDTFDWRELRIPLPKVARPPGTREVWISLAAERVKPDGAAWFDDVRLEAVESAENVVPNGSFEAPVLEVHSPRGWTAEAGGAELAIDRTERLEGRFSLRVTGRGRPVRLVQRFDLTPLAAGGVRRVRISVAGQCAGLGMDRVRFEVYGSPLTNRPILSLTGDQGWQRKTAVLDVEQCSGKPLALWINAPAPFVGSAWFDDVRIEEVPDGETVNLLLNTQFRQASANPRLPDYWGAWGDAVLCVEPWTLDHFGVDPHETAPVPGARVLKMHHPARGTFVPLPPANRLSYYLLHGADLLLPEGSYTFSAFVKSAREGTAVEVRHPADDRGNSLKIGRHWQRIAVTGTNPKSLPCIRLVEPDSTVWFAAPQLESGTVATSYRPAPGEDDVGAKLFTRPEAPSPPPQSPPSDVPAFLSPAANQLTVFAEYDFYSVEPVGRAFALWSGTTPASVHARLLDAQTGAVVEAQPTAIEMDGPGRTEFPIDIANLPPGRYGIQAVALAGGQKVARSLDTFDRRPPFAHAVRLNRASRSAVMSDKPFFPIFMPIEFAQLGAWHIDRLRSAGINCLVAAPGRLRHAAVHENGLADQSTAEIRTVLDRLQQQGMKCIWPLAWTFSDWEETRRVYGGDVRGLAGTYVRIVEAYRDHPAVIAWYLVDEPSPATWEGSFGFKESDMAVLHDAVKAADPHRPAFVNWNHGWAHEPYGGLACTDIIGHDNYSTSEEPHNWESLVPSVRMINDNRAGRRPAWAWVSGSYDEQRLRPSADAVRVHAWLHFIYGTRGIGYWSKPPLDPDVWEEIRRINRDITSLHAKVTGHRDARLLANRVANGTVHYAVWSLNNRAYLMAINTDNRPTTWHFDIAKAVGAEPLAVRMLFTSDSRPTKTTPNLTLTSGPFERRVYEFDFSPPLTSP